MDAFRKILKNEGLFGGLMSGYTVTLLRDVPFAATYFMTYELGKHVQLKAMTFMYDDCDGHLTVCNTLLFPKRIQLSCM